MIHKQFVKSNRRKGDFLTIITDYLVFLALILFSGNPVLQPFGKYGWCTLGLLGLVTAIQRWHRYKSELVLQNTLIYIVFAATIVFIGQTFIFGWNSINNITLFFAKILGGFYVVNRLKDNLRYVYLNVIFFISLFSIFFWLLYLNKINIPFIYNYGGGDSFLLLYCRRHDEVTRNCGAFWEPGVFACYINFLLFLWGIDLAKLWKKHTFRCTTLIIALLSTQSTTGYLSFGVFLILYFLFILKARWRYLIIPFLCTLFVSIYTATDFLAKKISMQSERALDANGEFSSTRVGSFIFDMHYIKKSPLFGNGLHQDMRWEDHMWLWKAWQNNSEERSGSGLSDFMASMGIPFCFLLFYLSYKSNKHVGWGKVFVLFILLIMILMGEPLMLYPLCLSFPFYRMSPIPPNKSYLTTINNSISPKSTV